MNLIKSPLLFLCLVLFAYAANAENTDYAGADSNNNQIRDDVDTYISTVHTSDLKKTVLVKQAKVLQEIMKLDVQDNDATAAVGKRYMKVMSCLAGIYTVNGEDPSFMRLSRELTEKTFDTKERDTKSHVFLGKIEKMNMNSRSTLGTRRCNQL